jgi:hypothetical protein
MSLNGLICPIGTLTEGRKTCWKDCLSLECLNCLPYPMRKAIHTSLSIRTQWLSPSTVTGCLRKAKWQLNKDFYLPPQHAYWFMRGSFIHEILEKASDPGGGNLIEEPVSRSIDGTGFVMRGTIDRFVKDTHTLYDYKTMADTGMPILRRSGKPKSAHVWQTNIYKWMLTPLYKVKDIKIVYIAMGLWAITGETITYDKWGKIEVYDMEPMPLYTDERIQDYLYNRVAMVEKVDNPPADVSEKWLCDICPFLEECRRTDEEPF